jgi:hypothetical protein
MLGGNENTLAVVNSFRPSGGAITARLVPIAWTPIGAVVGDAWQNVGIALAGLVDWMDRTFAPEDRRAFVAPVRDVELLARTGWESALPEALDDDAVLNIEDIPEDVADALAQPAASIVQCAACRRLCVRDEFVWKEKQLCAWDFHAQAFGKRGPWHEAPYETRHFETIPSCAYVSALLLVEGDAEIVLLASAIEDETALAALNVVIAAGNGRPHMAVRTHGGYTLLRENVDEA